MPARFPLPDGSWSKFFVAALLCSLLPRTVHAEDEPDIEEVIVKNDAGQVVEQYTLVDGNIHGPYKSFHSNGMTRCEATFTKGQLKGDWTYSYPSGKTFARGEAYGSRLVNDASLPLLSGRWTWYYSDGKVAFEGTFIEDRLEGEVRTYQRNGNLTLLANFTGGQAHGNWTELYDGKIKAHGAVTSGSASRGHARQPYIPVIFPKKTGHWIQYYAGSENKASEGSYYKNRRVGTWIYYWSRPPGKVSSIRNYNYDGSIYESERTTDPDTGQTTYRCENVDGSFDVIVTDADGQIVSRTYEPAPGAPPPLVSYTDEQTGVTISAIRDERGNLVITRSRTSVDDDGTRHIHEEDDNGVTREITERPDGSRTVRAVDRDGTVSQTTQQADGKLTREVTHTDGTSTTYTRNPDGTQTLVKRDAEGNITLQTTRDADGSEARSYPDGSTARRHQDADGNTVETREYADGSREELVRDPQSKVSRRELAPARKLEPGQTLYEQVEGGADWDALPDSEKAEYAEREAKLREAGILDQMLNNASAHDRRRQDADGAAMDGVLTDANRVLARQPAADRVPKENQRLLDDGERREADLALQGVQWVLDLPDTSVQAIQEELARAIDEKNGELIKELMSTDRRDLVGFLNRHPQVLQNWEQRVKPTLNAGTSALASGLLLTQAVDQAFEGDYAEALQSFLEAGANGIKAIPPDELAKIEAQLGRSPSDYALAVKSLVGFMYEAFREPTAENPRSWGRLIQDGAYTLYHLFNSLPAEQRAHFIERQLPIIRKQLKSLADNTPNARAVLGLLEAAPEIEKLYREWDTGQRWINISNLAQKLGPKVVGALVKASTGSDAAADLVEGVIQLGADYMAHLGAEAREATARALDAAESEANASARLRQELQRLAREAGMTEEDARSYDFLISSATGHRSGLVLHDMRQNKDLLGIREAMQAWRRVNEASGHNMVGVKHFLNLLVDEDERADEGHYQNLIRDMIANARLNITVIDRKLPQYEAGTAAHRFLSALRHDLSYIVRAFGD